MFCKGKVIIFSLLIWDNVNRYKIRDDQDVGKSTQASCVQATIIQGLEIYIQQIIVLLNLKCAIGCFLFYVFSSSTYELILNWALQSSCQSFGLR